MLTTKQVRNIVRKHIRVRTHFTWTNKSTKADNLRNLGFDADGITEEAFKELCVMLLLAGHTGKVHITEAGYLRVLHAKIG